MKKRTLLLIISICLLFTQTEAQVAAHHRKGTKKATVPVAASKMLNNAAPQTLSVLPTFPNNGWSSKTIMTASQWGHSVTSSFNQDFSGGFIYSISGGDGSFATTSMVQIYNTVTETWSAGAPIPQARLQGNSARLGGSIHAPGGYTVSFTPTTQHHIYDISANSWTLGTPLPTAVGDYAIGTYKDEYIYVIGGYNGSADVNLVQVFNKTTGQWSQATPKPGTAAAGLRGAIVGNKIVVGGGYSQTQNASISDAWLGEINAADPTQITWTALPALPFGPANRLAAGAFGNRIYFTGGDPNGGGSQYLAHTYAYNLAESRWEEGPSKITAVSNIVSFTPMIVNDKVYMVSTGGYSGAASNVNEWLELGPYCDVFTAATSQTDATCFAATNGTATVTPSITENVTYNWNTVPAQTTATATNLGAGTYTATIKYMGCTITKEVTITAPQRITLTSATLAQGTINAPYNQTITATQGSGGNYTWQLATGASIPNGMNLSATGQLTGTPTETGDFSFDVVVNDVNCSQSATATFNLKVLKGSQSITLVTVPEKTYGDAPFIPGATSSASLPVAYSSADNSIAEAYTDAADGNTWKLRIKKTGTVTITASQPGNTQFNSAVSKTFDLTIVPKPITVSFSNTANLTKMYDGTDQGIVEAADLSFAAGDIINGDVVTLSLSNASGTYDNKNAGDSKTFTLPVSAIQLNGAAAGNYSISNSGNLVSNSASITKATQSINWNQELNTGCNGPVAPIQLTAISSKGLPVTYVVTNPAIATIAGNTLTLVQPGETSIVATQTGDANHEAASAVTLDLQYPHSNLIKQHWSDVLFFDNSSNDYVKWQWFKNDIAVPGATSAYFNEGAPLIGTYYVEVTNKNGNKVKTCPLTLNGGSNLFGGIQIKPNPAKPGNTVTVVCNYIPSVLQGAKLVVSTITGTPVSQVSTVQHFTNLTVPQHRGLYIVTLLLSNGQKATANLLVR